MIILSAALDLVPSTTPKGVVLFFNIAPALVAKVVYPYVTSGRISYPLRILSCVLLSTLGIFLIAFLPSLPLHLLGISLASFSSGLGELTFLQLSTAYDARWSLGAFASGTGGAGILGAGLWWCVKGWGVRKGLGSMSVFPLGMAVAYWGILQGGRWKEGKDTKALSLPGSDRDGLTLREKWVLARPLIGKVAPFYPLSCSCPHPFIFLRQVYGTSVFRLRL